MRVGYFSGPCGGNRFAAQSQGFSSHHQSPIHIHINILLLIPHSLQQTKCKAEGKKTGNRKNNSLDGQDQLDILHDQEGLGASSQPV